MEHDLGSGSGSGGSDSSGGQSIGRRRALGSLLSTAVVAGMAGGAAGSAITAAALTQGTLVPSTASASPPIQRSAGSTMLLPDQGVKAVYQQVAPAVVSVQTSAARAQRNSQAPTPAPQPGPQAPQAPLLPRGEGTGFIIDADGHILTNNHVVDGASRVTVVLQSGGRVEATVVGTDPASDLALLKATIPAGRAGTAVLGDSDAVEPGDPAIAIGTPFGLEHTVTAGIISAVNRDFGTAGGRPMRGLIQTDAPINPGNSGGPLLNVAGQVIGITTAIESPVRGSVGVGFAIPVNAAKRLLPDLLAGRTPEHSWLGISGIALTPETAAEVGLPASVTDGVLIAGVQPDSPAARAGLRGGTSQGGGTPTGGDVTLAVDNRSVRRVQDVSGYLDTKRPGDVITLTILRNGSRQDVRATLGVWPRQGA